jgi:hypothetical protein
MPERGEPFTVDYLFHSLIVLAVLAICLLLANSRRRAKLADHQMELAAKNRKRRERQEAKAASHSHRLPNEKAVVQRELKKVPTPWGWPGSDVGHGAKDGRYLHRIGPGSSLSSLRHWVERLVAEKRTVDDAEYRQMKSEALRSMVEDRYGHTPQATRMKYQKVKPPRLRDPSRPYDQEDNFPSGQTEKIVKKLSQQPGKPEAEQDWRPFRKVSGLENIKKPWGW